MQKIWGHVLGVMLHYAEKYSENSRSITSPGRAGSESISKAALRTFFCKSFIPGLPSEFPTLKSFGYIARGGRINFEASGPTVIKTVGMPNISISRCTATTVRWQTFGQPPVKITASARERLSISSAICGAVSSYICLSCIV